MQSDDDFRHQRLASALGYQEEALQHTGSSARNPPVTLLIVEEEEVIRHGLLALASSIPEVTAVAVDLSRWASHAKEMFAVSLCSTRTIIAAEQASIAIDDLQPLLVIVSSTEPHHLETAMRKKARGYLLQRDLGIRSLQKALSEVVFGEGTTIPVALTAYMRDQMGDADVALRYCLHNLSPREAAVLALLVNGSSNKEIARKLGISTHSVKRYVSSLLSQTHSPNRAHLISRVFHSGVAIHNIESGNPGRPT